MMTTQTYQQALPREIQLCSYAFLSKTAEGLSFTHHSLPLTNDEPHEDYVTGAFGVFAFHHSDRMAKHQAEADGTVSMRVNVKAQLRAPIPGAGRMDRQAMEEVGLFCPRRMELKLYEELRLRLLALLKPTVSAADHLNLRELTMQGILLAYPVGARLLMAEEPLLDMLVYKGVPRYKSDCRRMINVATVRAARESGMVTEALLAEHISVSKARFH